MDNPAPPTDGAALRVALAEAIYDTNPLLCMNWPSRPGPPLNWQFLDGRSRAPYYASADAALAGPIAQIRSDHAEEIERLTRERDEHALDAERMRRERRHTDARIKAQRAELRELGPKVARIPDLERRAAAKRIRSRGRKADLLDLAKMYGEACADLMKSLLLVVDLGVAYDTAVQDLAAAEATATELRGRVAALEAADPVNFLRAIQRNTRLPDRYRDAAAALMSGALSARADLTTTQEAGHAERA